MSAAPITVDYINGPVSESVYGMKRYQEGVHSRTPRVRLNRIEYKPPKNRLLSFLSRLLFPFQVLFSIRSGRPKHLTTQFLGHLLLLPGMENSVITIYDTIFLERYQDFHPLSRIFIRLNVLGARRASKVVTISQHSARQIENFMGIPGEKIEVVTPGLDLSAFGPVKGARPPWIPQGSPAVLCLGSEEPRQNIDKVILAVASLRKEFPGMVLLKAGNPQWRGGREALSILAGRLGMQGRVRFLGYVPEEKLPALYSFSDVFVYPCSSAGWGLPPAEAMACGTPVVTSGLGPLPEVVGGCAIRVDPESPSEIAAAIKQVVLSRAVRKRMSRCGLARAKQFSWISASKKMEKVYLSML